MNKFKFKQFELAHDRSAFKVGTDSILLGSWISGSFKSIADLGCGSGLLALMCAQKFTEARIVGVEIDFESAQQAKKNVLDSPWSERVEVLHDDVKNLSQAQYDLIISNPPYFPLHVKSVDQRKNTARQEAELCLQDLLKVAKRISHSASALALVYPFDRFEELKHSAKREGWFIRKELRLISKPGKPIERVLVQFERLDGKLDSKSLCIPDQAGEYSPEFQELTGDFYLGF